MLLRNVDAQQNPDTETPESSQFYLYQLQQKPQFFLKKNYNFMILNSDYKIQIVIASSQNKNIYMYTYVLYTTYTKRDDGLQWGPKHVAMLIKINVLCSTEVL